MDGPQRLQTPEIRCSRIARTDRAPTGPAACRKYARAAGDRTSPTAVFQVHRREVQRIISLRGRE